eukprot:2629689-Pyramimonas_sp.AAC.1
MTVSALELRMRGRRKRALLRKPEEMVGNCGFRVERCPLSIARWLLNELVQSTASSRITIKK